MKINILLADDHIIILDALKSLISTLLPEVNVTRASDMDTVLVCLKQQEIQLVICDINMPGANHFGIVKMIKSIKPETKLLILSAYSPALYAQRYLQEGADAYLSKNADTSEIRNTIINLLQEASGIGSAREKGLLADPHAVDTSPLKILSNRELEVAQLLIEGNGILEIANLLQIHVNTVSTYKARVFEKVNITSIPELVAIFRNYTSWGIG